VCNPVKSTDVERANNMVGRVVVDEGGCRPPMGESLDIYIGGSPMRAGWVSGAESKLGVLGISASPPDTGRWRWYLAIGCSL
jgi:hypothetical protein